MRFACTALIAATLVSACASAQDPALPAIADNEPDVTAQVHALLVRTMQGQLQAEPLSENARAALTPERSTQIAERLRRCTVTGKLDLLRRGTKGEERQYLYRLPCGAAPLLVEINFGKGARISYLDVRPQ